MFIAFKNAFNPDDIPEELYLSDGDNAPHWLCLLAAQELQGRLSAQTSLNHNFGLDGQTDTAVVGKMFGVLVVDSPLHGVGYLAAFSGKLGGKNLYKDFVPPVFDLLTEGSFLNTGMQELGRMNEQIKAIGSDCNGGTQLLTDLKHARRLHSIALQKQIFDQYHLVNQAGIEKSLNDIFEDAGYKNPPAGAAECAGIKLLQYAFKFQMKPIALAEFWWGESPKSAAWKHGHFYACCKEKCAPILSHMLS